MPTSWDDTTDSPIVFDAVTSFVGGQNSNANPRLIGQDQAAFIKNGEISVTGTISTRFGSAQIGNPLGIGTGKVDALAFMNTPAVTAPIAICNNAIFELGGTTWMSLSPILVTDQPSIVQGADKIYFPSNGIFFSYDGTSFVPLSGNGATEGPPGATILLWHTNRLIAAGPLIKSFTSDTVPIPDAIYFSNFLDPTVWGTTKIANQLRVGAGDGQANIAIIPWGGFNLAVFKRRSVWVVGADPSLDVSLMPIQLVHGGVGCVARRSAVQVGSDILFLADDGVRSLSQVIGSDTQHELTTPLSYPVQDIINRINWSVAGGACAIFWRNLYILALPLDTNTLNDTILVFNTVTKSWQGIWTGLPINSIAVREVDGVPRLMLGLATQSKVFEYNDWVNPLDWTDDTWKDDNKNVRMQVTSRAMTFGDPLSPKVGLGYELEWSNSKGGLDVTPILDGASQDSVRTQIPSGGFPIPVDIPFIISAQGSDRSVADLLRYGEFRDLQFDFAGAGGGRQEITQIAASAISRPSLVGNS